MTIDMKAIPSLYDITGDIKDINTMLVPKQLLEAAEKALAEPEVKPHISTEHCSFAERQRHQASVNQPSDDLYCPRCQCSERFLQSRRCEPHIVYETPSPPPPTEPAVEPVQPDVLEKLSYHCHERDDLTLDDCLTYLQTNGWHKVRGRTERSMLLQLTALMAASPPPPPAEVPLLSDDEIRALFMAQAKKNWHGVPYLTTYIEGGAHLIRTVEQAVRRAFGAQ